MDPEVKKSLERRLRLAIANAIENLATASCSLVPMGSIMRAQQFVNEAAVAAAGLNADDADIVLSTKGS